MCILPCSTMHSVFWGSCLRWCSCWTECQPWVWLCLEGAEGLRSASLLGKGERMPRTAGAASCNLELGRLAAPSRSPPCPAGDAVLSYAGSALSCTRRWCWTRWTTPCWWTLSGTPSFTSTSSGSSLSGWCNISAS